MLITIITVSYNSEKTIEKTISSILQQEHKDIEYIVVDGNSSDSTKNILKKHESDFAKRQIIYKWISEDDSGTSEAMNKGIAISTGEVIGFLASDDWYNQDTLKVVQQAFVQDTSADIIHGGMMLCNKEGDNIRYCKPRTNYKRLWMSMMILFPSVFVKKGVLKNIGGFNEKYKLANDYDFILRAWKANCKFNCIDTSLTNMRKGGMSDLGLLDSWRECEIISIDNGLNPIYAKAFNVIRHLKYRIRAIISHVIEY